MEGSRGSSGREGDSGRRSREVARRGQEKASEYAEKGREQAKPQIAKGKERASEQLEGIANALRSTGEQLHEQDQGSVGGYAEQAADQVERLSGYLRDRDPDRLLGDVEDFARERPAVFLGGAFLLAAAAARFLKSSAGQREEFDVRESARELGSSATGKDLDEFDSASTENRGFGEDQTGEKDQPSYSDEEDWSGTISFSDEGRMARSEDFDAEQPVRKIRRSRRPRRGSDDATE